MATSVRSHLLIRVRVVSYNDQGVILVADARHGKTTLTLKLREDRENPMSRPMIC